jgi:hypothetical protein
MVADDYRRSLEEDEPDDESPSDDLQQPLSQNR